MSRPSLPSPPFEGGCLCGAVRYTIAARPLAVNACHCIDCKRSSGGTHAIFLHARQQDMQHEGGAVERFRKTADSGRLIDIARCKACGTRLWHEPLSAPDLVFVARGTLDASDWALPTSHIFARTIAADVTPEPDAMVIDGPPADRQALWDRFAQIYPD